MAGDRSGALAHIDDDSLLDRIESGENPARIAHSLGVHKSAIYHRFANKPDYKRARLNGMAVRVEDAEARIENATDTFTLAQARELFKATAWRAEREFPEQWGQKANTNITIDLGSALQMLSERMQAKQITTIDAVREVEDKGEKSLNNQ